MDLITQITPTPEIIEEQDITLKAENRVVLFNDDWHTFEEVIIQIIKAVKCSFEQGRALAFEAHTNGKAVVFTGSIQNCLRVSSVLEEIALNTQIIS
ncbi:MAG: ATP-dependent Clp protease adaptor ClpS [Ignavibacteriales bacterium]|nr:MAG: ATP-dependent Clp protease adaptor ClpS [Ignavibacteriales bacterium]